MTVLERVREDVKNGCVITETAPGTCAICGAHQFLRYGCCRGCAPTTATDDPRLAAYPRVGDKTGEPDGIVSHRTPTDHCPACEYKLDAATSAAGDGAKPSAGDVSLCINCGALLEYTDDLHVIPMPRGTRDKLSPDVTMQLLSMQAKVRTRGRLPR